MPPVAAVAAVAFGAISAGAAIATAVGVTTFLGLSVATWTAIGAVGMLVSGLALAATMPKPKTPESAGQQLNMKLSGNDALPVMYGRTATGGSIYYRDTSGKSNKTLAMLVALSIGGAIGGVEQVRANDYQLSLSGGFNGGKQTTVAAIGDTDSKSKMFKKNSLHFWHLNGADPQSSTFAQVSGLPIPAQRASGVATAIVQADYDQEAFPQGLPKFMWIGRGVRVYDPRKDSTYPGGSGSHRIDNPATWEFSENPHLCALNWTLGRWKNGKKLYGIGVPADQVDIPAFVSGANIADALGWKVGGVVQTTDNKFDVLGSLLQAGGAIPLARGAQISCLTYAVKASIYNIGINDVVGGASVVNTAPHRDRKNRITPTYREESQFWNLVPGEAVSADQYVQEDSGEVRSTEITLPFVQNAAQAHQLATYDLVNTREFLTFEITAKPKLLGVRVGDCVTVDLPDIAVNNQKCMVVQRDFDPATFQVKLTLRSETDAKHAYALGQSQVAPPSPTLTSFDPSNPDGPGEGSWTLSGNSITIPPTEEQLANGIANTVIVPALIVEGANDDPTTSQVIFEWRRPLIFEEGVPIPEPDIQAEMGWIGAAEGHKAITRAEITNVLPNTDYEVSVSYRTVLGVKSSRLILGPLTTSEQRVGGVQDGGIDWNANTIVNVPPILRDANALAELAELANTAITDALEDLDNAVSDLGNSVADLDQLLDTTAGDVANAVARLDGVWSVVGEHDGEGLRRTVIELVENATGDTSEIVTRVTGLEQIVNAEGAQALARMTDLAELETAIDGTYAKATALSGLQSTVTSQGTTISGLSTRMTTAETNINGKANVSDLNNLTSRVTTAEGDIDATNTRLDTVETDVAGKASATSVNNLQSEITGARNGSVNLGAQLSTMRQTVTDGLAGKASTSALTTLTGRVTTAEGNISGALQRLDTVETDMVGKASTTSVTTLNNEIVAGRNGATSLKARIDGLQTTLTDAINLKASTSQVNSIESTLNLKPQTYAQTSAPSTSGRIVGDLWMDTDDNNQLYRWNGSSWANAGDLRGEAALAEIIAARGGQANLNARFTQVNSTITDGLAGKASAQSVTDLTATVNGYSSTISSVQSVAVEANNRSKAIIGLTSTVGGLVTGISSVNNGSQTSFRIQADKFELVPSGTGARTEFSAGAWKIYDSSNRKRIHLGLG